MFLEPIIVVVKVIYILLKYPVFGDYILDKRKPCSYNRRIFAESSLVIVFS